MKVGSLFAGIGGFDLAARWHGWRTVWYAERDPEVGKRSPTYQRKNPAGYAAGRMAEHFPGVPNLGDVTSIDWRQIERPDLVCGGFPCQPASNAGKRLGNADERWLWPEFARCLRAVRPRFAIVENVPGLLARGMGEVLGDLAAIGYDAEWLVLSAADVGAPHLRDRVWIVAALEPFPDAISERLRILRQWIGEQRLEQGEADPRDDGDEGPLADTDLPGPPHDRESHEGSAIRGDDGWRDSARSGGTATPAALADPNGGGRQVGREPECAGESGAFRRESDRRDTRRRRPRPSADPEGAGREGEEPARDSRARGCAPEYRQGRRLPDWWATEPDVGRVAHGVSDRVDRLHGLGNAIVPECAFQVFATLTTELR